MTKEWIRQRKRDPYYKRAKSEGYRSRAAYKLKEMNNRLNIIRKGGRVLDLGAAPGGWSQVTKEIIGPEGTVVAVDLHPIDSIEGVRFVQGDIEDPLTLQKVKDISSVFDVVISDVSPNLSGNRTLDRGRSMALSWAVMKMSLDILRPGGSALVKMFQGSEVDELKEEFGPYFYNFDRMKPRSSLKRSIEIYLAFRGYKREADDAGQADDGSV